MSHAGGRTRAELTWGQDARIACILDAAHSYYENGKEALLSARKDMPGSRRLSNQAEMIIELMRSAGRAPHTNFMLDIAVNVLK